MVNIPKIGKVADSLTFKHIPNPNTVYTLFLTKYLNRIESFIEARNISHKGAL